jgi:hypothetical protein
MKGSGVGMSAGNRIIVGAEGARPVSVYEPSGSGWGPAIELTSPIDPFRFGRDVAIDDNRAFVSGTNEAAIHVYNRNSGAWSHAADIVTPDGDHLFAGVPDVSDLVFSGFGIDPHRGGSVRMFKEVSAGEYLQVARLVPSDGAYRKTYVGSTFDGWANGSFARVAAGDDGPSGGLYVFDLNEWGTTPAPRQYDFEVGGTGDWTPIAGSSFAVVNAPSTKVYRQSATTGDAGSYVTSIDWKNQAIEADIKPTAFNGSDRWVGLALRRTDASNYYYATLRQSNVLDIKRRVNGAFVTLASVPQPVVLNRNYHLRFEAIGTLLRVYLNGALALQVRDTSLTHGNPGVQMYKAQANYDNIVVSQNPHLTLMDQSLTYRYFNDRFVLGPGTWVDDISTGKQVGLQTSTAGDARAVNRIVTDDQIVQARVSPTQFAAGTGSRWFGLLARYVDAGNYYYVTLRSDNTISLRKLVNGAIHVLDSAPLPVSVGGSYLVRLEAVGVQLRVYVNGNFLLEAKDSTHARGKYGPAMYKTAASYQDFLVWEP